MATARQKTTRKSTKAAVTTAPSPSAPIDITTRDAEGRTPLHWAAFYGYIDAVRQMIRQEAEVDARDDQQRTPGHWSAFKGHLPVVKALLDAGADVNARDAEGRTWLRMAVIGQKTEMEQFLRDRGGEL